MTTAVSHAFIILYKNRQKVGASLDSLSIKEVVEPFP